MLEGRDGSRSSESGQVTLMNLLLFLAFFMPVAAATTALKRSGGGTLRYLVAVPSALVLGDFDRLVGLEATESTVVEMPAIFQAGAKCSRRRSICGGVVLDRCWERLRIQAGGICRRAYRLVTYLRVRLAWTCRFP